MWCERFGQEKAEEIGDSEWRKTSFDATQGHICCVGWAIDDSEPVSDFIQTINDEKEVLNLFFSEIKKPHAHDHMRRPLFIGHNHVGFGSSVHLPPCRDPGVEPPIWMPRLPKAWDESVFDTMVEWAGHNNRTEVWTRCAGCWALPGKTAWMVRWSAIPSCKARSKRLPRMVAAMFIGRAKSTGA